jgi:hypothetical protein
VPRANLFTSLGTFMAIQPGRALPCPEIPTGEMFGLEGEPVYRTEAREVVEGRSVLIAGLVTRYAAGRGYPVPAIRFTGRRAGEKPGEELIAHGETPRPALHPAITAVDAVTVPPDGIVRWCAPDGSVSERTTAGSRPGVPVAEAVEWFRSQPAAA